MARIRSQHPTQWTDEDFVQMTPMARLLTLGIRNEADDQGVFEWKPITLKMRLLPVDNVDVNEMLAEMVEHHQVRHFEVDGKAYGAIRNFQKFQRPKKPNAIYPLPEDLRAYVGAEAGTSPEPINPEPKPVPKPSRPTKDNSRTVAASNDASSEPVGNQFRTGGEISPQMEEVIEGGRGRVEKEDKASASGVLDSGGNREPSEMPPIPDALKRGRKPDPASEIIQAFDRARVEVFGEMQARSHPHPQDRMHATRWLQIEIPDHVDRMAVIAGAFESALYGKRSKGEQPIGVLSYFANAVPEALAKAAKGEAPAVDTRHGFDPANRPPEEDAYSRLIKAEARDRETFGPALREADRARGDGGRSAAIAFAETVGRDGTWPGREDAA